MELFVLLNPSAEIYSRNYKQKREDYDEKSAINNKCHRP
jgi:hypothetical protein